MKNFILLLLGIIVALLVVGGAVAYTSVSNVSDGVSEGSSLGEIIDKVSNVASSQQPASDSSSASSSDDNGGSDSGSDVVSEEVKYNYQDDGGYYREVTYKDGGFRQYDSESGELIGSSYDSDQDKLPSME